MLELNKEVGNKNITDNEKEKVNDVFTTTIIGNNNVIISGDNNTQKVHIKIATGSFTDLKEQFEKSGIAENDIVELQTIIDNDNFNTNNKRF